MRTIDLAPDFAERIRAGRQRERYYCASDLPNFYRKPYGPGWALVGDAGLHKDPFLALGICDAWRDAELLANAIGDGLSARRPLDQALAEFESQRDAAGPPTTTRPSRKPVSHRYRRRRSRCGPPSGTIPRKRRG